MLLQNITTRTTRLGTSLLFVTILGISACGGGGGGGGGGSKNGTTSFTVGGTISGLVGSVVLQNNHGDNLTLTTNDPFTFSTAIANGNTYDVTVLTQPTDLTCTVGTGSGTVFGNNVTNVIVTCSAKVYTVSTFAGAAAGFDGTGASARFGGVSSVTSDGTNLYVAEMSNRIRKIVIATGVVTTLAGSGRAGAADGVGTAATFSSPNGMVTDGTNLYVADSGNNKIRKIVIATGVVSSLTGVANTPGPASNTTCNATPATCAVDGAGVSATFNRPTGVTIAGTNLYVTDANNNKIRKIDLTTGNVSSFTGVTNTSVGGAVADGSAATASFWGPHDITNDGTYLYVLDSGNNKIRKVLISDGSVSSLTGVANTMSANGAADGAAAGATFSQPYGLTIDKVNGLLYVADNLNNKIRKIVISTGDVSSVTGTTSATAAAGSANGSVGSATFNEPYGITYVGGNLYVADMRNNLIRTISSSLSQVSTLAGTPPGIDGTGPSATFYAPMGVTSDGTNLYVADGAGTIRKIVISTGVVSTLAGSGAAFGTQDGPGASATFSQAWGVTTDGTNVYVVDDGNNKIRKIVIATGEVSSLTGPANGGVTAGAQDGPCASASFDKPIGITTDGTNLYVTDSRNYKIRKIVLATCQVSSLTGTANTPGTSGAKDGAAASATFAQAWGITTDGTNLYVADAGNNKIRKIVISTGFVSSVTGAADTTVTAGATDGTSNTAAFDAPRGITTDGANLFISDVNNNKIRKIVIATGVVSSLTGLANTPGVPDSTDGSGTTANFSGPMSIVSVGTSLYVADTGNQTIRKLQ